MTQHTAESTLYMGGEGIYVREDGPRNAPALLLIHGSGSSSHAWDPLVPLLTTSHRVIRLDLLGHGQSAKPEGPFYGIPEQALRVGAVLDRLGITRLIAVGHSSGGYTATALAEQRPDLLTALALINTGPHLNALITTESTTEPSQWADLTDEQIRQVMDTAFSLPGYRIPGQLVDDVRAMTYHSFTATQQASREYLEQSPLPDRLRPLGLPLLVLFGKNDRRWDSASATDYQSVPGAQIELLPVLGHSPNLENPPRTAASLLPFTTTVARTRQ